jgi:hypothetical protein
VISIEEHMCVAPLQRLTTYSHLSNMSSFVEIFKLYSIDACCYDSTTQITIDLPRYRLLFAAHCLCLACIVSTQYYVDSATAVMHSL